MIVSLASRDVDSLPLPLPPDSYSPIRQVPYSEVGPVVPFAVRAVGRVVDNAIIARSRDHRANVTLGVSHNDPRSVGPDPFDQLPEAASRRVTPLRWMRPEQPDLRLRQ